MDENKLNEEELLKTSGGYTSAESVKFKYNEGDLVFSRKWNNNGTVLKRWVETYNMDFATLYVPLYYVDVKQYGIKKEAETELSDYQPDYN